MFVSLPTDCGLFDTESLKAFPFFEWQQSIHSFLLSQLRRITMLAVCQSMRTPVVIPALEKAINLCTERSLTNVDVGNSDK